MKIAIVIVLYNPNQGDLENVLLNSTYGDIVIVIDNSVGAESYVDFFKTKSDKIMYIRNYNNGGLTGALNRACRLAYELGYEYCITFDQDSRIIEKGFTNYIEKAISVNVAIVSPQYIIDRKHDIKLRDGFCDTIFTLQSASVFNLELLNKLGYFDENMYLDCTDYEYCLRVHRAGYKTLVYNGYAINHKPGITKTTIFGFKYGYCSPIRIYYQIRNLKYLYKKYKYWKIRLILFYKFIKIIIFFNDKKDYLKMWRKARHDFKNNKFGCIEDEY